MLFSEMRTRFAKFMGTEDTVQPGISSTDRDTLLNEAGIEYLARYGVVTRYTAARAAASNSNNLTIGLSADGQWAECLLLYKVGTGRPLHRVKFSEVVMTTDGEALQVSQERYALALVSRTIDGASLFKLVVAPRALGAASYVALFRPFASELVNVGDVFECDDNQADHICRIAALRGGALFHYGPAWFQSVMAPLPEHVKAEMAIDSLVRFPSTPSPLPNRLTA